jgi:RNA polymerase sigma factor (sigma-70 family)
VAIGGVEIERAIREARDRLEPQLIQAIAPIVWANYDRGRVHRFLANGDVAGIDDYIDVVAAHFREQHDYVRRVQIETDPELWDILFQQLQRRAYGILTKDAFLEPRERYEHALQCATDASLVIADRHFPYDASFEAWAYVVLRYTCKNHMRKHRGGRSVPRRAQVSLDAHDGWLHNLSDPGAEQMHRRLEQRHDLLQQVERLGDAQRRFVLLYYFEQKSYAEVADILKKNKNALYKLNFDALDNLRKGLMLMDRTHES